MASSGGVLLKSRSTYDLRLVDDVNDDNVECSVLGRFTHRSKDVAFISYICTYIRMYEKFIHFTRMSMNDNRLYAVNDICNRMSKEFVTVDGNVRKIQKETLTPYKVATVILIKEYCNDTTKGMLLLCDISFVAT